MNIVFFACMIIFNLGDWRRGGHVDSLDRQSHGIIDGTLSRSCKISRVAVFQAVRKAGMHWGRRHQRKSCPSDFPIVQWLIFVTQP